MRKFFNGLVLGLLLGVAAGWYFFDYRRAQVPTPAETRAQQATAQAIQSAGDAAYHLTEAVKAKMESLDLRPEQIQEELSRTGKVVRRRAVDLGEQIADATVDARITTVIKGKLAIDRDLSARSISVTTAQEHVTLSGSVSSAELVSKAILLALETDGVRDVTSTLQIDAKK